MFGWTLYSTHQVWVRSRLAEILEKLESAEPNERAKLMARVKFFNDCDAFICKIVMKNGEEHSNSTVNHQNRGNWLLVKPDFNEHLIIINCILNKFCRIEMSANERLDAEKRFVKDEKLTGKFIEILITRLNVHISHDVVNYIMGIVRQKMFHCKLKDVYLSKDDIIKVEKLKHAGKNHHDEHIRTYLRVNNKHII